MVILEPTIGAERIAPGARWGRDVTEPIIGLIDTTAAAGSQYAIAGETSRCSSRTWASGQRARPSTGSTTPATTSRETAAGRPLANRTGTSDVANRQHFPSRRPRGKPALKAPAVPIGPTRW